MFHNIKTLLKSEKTCFFLPITDRGAGNITFFLGASTPQKICVYKQNNIFKVSGNRPTGGGAQLSDT